MCTQNKLTLNIALILLLSTNSMLVNADHGSLGFGLGTASPIVTDTGITLPEGMWATGLRTQFISFNTPSDAQLLDKANAHGDVHSVSKLIQPSLFAAYGITDDLTLGLRVPWSIRTSVRSPTEDKDAVNQLGDANGFGDVSVFGQYRFWHSVDNLNHASVITGVKAPTGVTGVYSKLGSTFEPHFQPGSGSWDPMFGLAFTRAMGQFSFDTSMMYAVSTSGMRDADGNRYDMGDAFNYNIALSYAVSNNDHSGLEASSNNQPLTLVLELNGETRAKQKAGGVVDVNSGGTTLYLSPGIRYAGGKGWNTALSFGAPIVHEYSGYQTPPDYRIIHRFTLTF